MSTLTLNGSNPIINQWIESLKSSIILIDEARGRGTVDPCLDKYGAALALQDAKNRAKYFINALSIAQPLCCDITITFDDVARMREIIEGSRVAEWVELLDKCRV